MPVPARNSASPRVLLVEDDADSAEALLLVLQRAGYHASWFGSARPALDVLRGDARHRPDVMLLDLTLPDLAGAELIDAFLAVAPLPPTVVISAAPEKTLRTAAERLQARGALRKPFGTDAFLAAVEEAASDRRASVR
jgi:two-component system KDP operon response regulator KdpE